MNLTNNLELNERLKRLSPEKRARLALKLSMAERKGAPEKTVTLPKVQPEPQNRFEQFPLSDLQQAYLIGREEGVELGNIACHNYFEVDLADWDQERFEAALDKLIARHEMLRCIVLPEGCQQVLKKVPGYKVKCADLRGQNPDAVRGPSRGRAAKDDPFRASHGCLASFRVPRHPARPPAHAVAYRI